MNSIQVFLSYFLHYFEVHVCLSKHFQIIYRRYSLIVARVLIFASSKKILPNKCNSLSPVFHLLRHFIIHIHVWYQTNNAVLCSFGIICDLDALYDYRPLSFNDRYLHVVATANKVLDFVLRFSKQLKNPYALPKFYASHWCCPAWNMSRLSGNGKVVDKFYNLLERVQRRSLRTLAYKTGCPVANDRYRSCLISQL